MTSFTLKPDKNSGHDPDDDPYPVRCPCGELLMTDGQRAHCGPCLAYDGRLEPVTITDPEEAGGDD
jgi:hypothetical protein